MEGTNLFKFLAVTLVIGTLASAAYFGTNIFNNKTVSKEVQQETDEKGVVSKTPDSKLVKEVRQEHGIKGGVYIVLQPEVSKELSPQQLENNMYVAKQVIRNRLSNKGIFDANVTTDTNNRLIVEIPGERNIQKVQEEIGKMAKLQFVGPDGEVIVEGNDIVNAQSERSFDSMTGQFKWVVTVDFSSQAAVKFADATERISKLSPQGKNYIAILLNGKPTSNDLPPRVSSRIDGGKAEISGEDFTLKSTEELVALIRSGSLPFSLKVIQAEVIEPTLDQ